MIDRLPPWFRREIPANAGVVANSLKYFEDLNLHTVCLSARCPNIYSCFKKNYVTFMISGGVCSRSCLFCAVGKGSLRRLDLSEAYNLALSVRALNLKYAVITSVTRDDLPYGGATQFVRVVCLIRNLSPQTKIELLIPDFQGQEKALSLISRLRLEVIGHNIETVERLFPFIRPQGNYRLSLAVLAKIRKQGFYGFTKSGIMLGLGESKPEVMDTIKDLREAGCDILTLGQYLAPSKNHAAVKEFVTPEAFELYRQEALKIGFKSVVSAPWARSSYLAQEAYSSITGGTLSYV